MAAACQRSHRRLLRDSAYGANNYQAVVSPIAADSIATCQNNPGMIAGSTSAEATPRTDSCWTRAFDGATDAHAKGKGSSTQIVSIDDAGTAISDYKSSSGSSAFELNIAIEQYSAMSPPQGNKIVATGINDTGGIVGYMTLSGSTVGFLLKDGTYTDFSYPGAATRSSSESPPTTTSSDPSKIRVGTRTGSY